MGSRMSVPLPKTPIKKSLPKKHQLNEENDTNSSDENTQNTTLDEEDIHEIHEIDSRSSPIVDRTPINLTSNTIRVEKITTQDSACTLEKNVTAEMTPVKIILKHTLLDDHFIHNLNDPRSPSQHIYRTPIEHQFFKKSTQDINDSKNDILNNSSQFCEHEINSFTELNDFEINDNIEEINNLSTHVNADEANLESSVYELDNISAILKSLPKDGLGLVSDPRSPSLEIERTPIVFDESSEVLLEIKDTKKETHNDIPDAITCVSDDNKIVKQSIYEEENEIIKYSSTPVKPMVVNEVKIKAISNNGHRTPLSCVANKSLVRCIYNRRNDNIKHVLGNSVNRIFADENISPIDSQSRRSISKIPILRK